MLGKSRPALGEQIKSIFRVAKKRLVQYLPVVALSFLPAGSDMADPPGATTISFLPTEILEILLLWEYPKFDTHPLKTELLRLSIFDIHYPQPLIETFSFRGHFITTLKIRLESIETKKPPLRFQQLSTPLRSLHLTIIPGCTPYAHCFPYPIPPFATRISLAELKELKSLSEFLPPQLEELVLAGFSWRDAAQGLAKARAPKLRRICLRLEARSRPPLATSNFLRGCPNVKDIELPASWCPKAEWFRRAFDGRQFEHALSQVPFGAPTIKDCMKTPASLTEYLDPRPNTSWQGQSDSGPYWPMLKYFKADFEFDQLSEGIHWNEAKRRKLESYCNERGISANIVWEWLESFREVCFNNRDAGLHI
ncbi:hypothetical protein DFS33DRAFT_1268942 [Desarmillaria ectypa]|nr:hypothetical protein DFS33DRAFT_1268942 [Desarmillaria ectypa]